MEKLFSQEELDEIENEALVNFEWYYDAVVLTGDATAKTIKTISKINHLIVVTGDDYTGFTHFNDRHNLFSNKNYWVKNDEQGSKLDDPSKFHPKMTPIIDYVLIADIIFKPENKNTTKNHSPQLFDKYTGIYHYSDGLEEKYHLILYKDTKIIHTMFPHKKKYNRKSKIKLGKGIVISKLKLSQEEAYNDLLIPYENSENIIVYSILIRKYYNEKIERLIIQKHDESGKPKEQFILGHRNFEEFEKFDKEIMMYYQHADLSELEDHIIRISFLANK